MKVWGEQNGHCVCCCNKWRPVRIRSNKTMRRTMAAMFKLVWTPSRRCSCNEWHKPQRETNATEKQA